MTRPKDQSPNSQAAAAAPHVSRGTVTFAEVRVVEDEAEEEGRTEGVVARVVHKGISKIGELRSRRTRESRAFLEKEMGLTRYVTERLMTVLGAGSGDESDLPKQAVELARELQKRGTVVEVQHKMENSAAACAKVADVLAARMGPSDFIVHMGVFPGKQGMVLERACYNWADFSPFGPDMLGFEPRGELIQTGAPQRVDSALDLEALKEQMQAALPSVPCSVSDDPARYCCNFLYFSSAIKYLEPPEEWNGENREVNENDAGRQRQVLFLHTPNLDVVPLEQQVLFLLHLLLLLPLSQ